MSRERTESRGAVAVVGMSGRFPGARTLREFWRNLREGVESLDTFTDAELEAAGVPAEARALPRWVSRGTVLQDAELFDADFFGYAPREAQIVDPQQRLFLECAWEAMEDAGYAGEPEGKTVAIYGGSSLNSYVFSQLLPNPDLMAAVGGYQMMLGNDKDFLTTRASYKLNLHGPSMSIQTACSTSLVAVQVACQALIRGECDMALAGGVSISFPQKTGYLYQEGMIFSPDGHCRPFDAEAAGTRAGAGAGIVVLKRLDEAIADGDTIQAVILGAAINNDGADKVGYTAPSVDGQIEVIATAQALAGVSPETISYVEAHGTATPMGDPIEIAALTRVYRSSTDRTGICAIGSLKANLGHLDAAAGVAGLIKTVLALRHREIPPQLNFGTPNPQLELERSPFRVVTALEAWPSIGGPRRAGVSSFGIGGTNAHVVLEEAPAQVPSVVAREEQLLVLSAKTPAALEAATANLVAYLQQPDAAPLADVAYTLQLGRQKFAYRSSVVAQNTADAVSLLTAKSRASVVTGQHSGVARPVAFLFSGQGSQHVGMGSGLYRREGVFRAAVDQCAEILRLHLGRDIRDVIWNDATGELNETRFAQPALFVTEYALAQLWKSWGVEPAAMLGHSIGEYVAAQLAGVFSLQDALLLVAARGRLMQGMLPGAMLAVKLPPAVLRARLVAGLEIAAVNAPDLCTVSGTQEAIETLVAHLQRDGIDHRSLHTSHAFHSAMMEPALAPFREIVSRVALSAPQRPVVSNVTGTWLRAEQATSPDYWTSHLRSAVLFADGVATLIADPTMQLLEVGPGNALTTLARLTFGPEGALRVSGSMPHPHETKSEAATMLSAAGRLWVNGVRLDWSAMHADESLHRVSLPTYPFERKRHWVDAPARAAAATPSADSYRREALDDLFYTPTWTRAPLIRSRLEPVKGSWLVFGRGDTLETAVRKALVARGASVIIVRDGADFSADAEHATVRATESGDYERLLQTLEKRGVKIGGVVHLWNCGLAESVSHGRGMALDATAALARALVRESAGARLRLVVATTGAQSVLGEALAYPDRALANGVVLVLPMEHEGVQASLIDLDTETLSVTAVAETIVDEASTCDAEQFVAIRSGDRFTRGVVSGSLPPVLSSEALKLTRRGVYLVTGGFGGIGVTLAVWLATTIEARLVLCSRTALPERGEWDAWLAAHADDEASSVRIRDIQRIEAAGGDVRIVVADVANVSEMRNRLEVVSSEWGPISGVIHAAGISGDGLIAFSDAEDAARTISSKVGGLDTLVSILGEQSLDVVMLCSSINAIGGVAGSYAYTAANAYLDAFAISSRRPDGWRTVSIAWDAWRDVGMATKVAVPAAMRAARAAYVANGIIPVEGAEAFGRCLASGQPLHVVSPYDIERVLMERRRRRAIPFVGAPTTSRADNAPDRRKDLGATLPHPSSSVESKSDVEARLASIWIELLGVQEIGVDDNFFDLGGHSLMATRVIARIDQHFAVRLPLREMFTSPTIRQLGVLIGTQTERAMAPESADDGDREEFEL